MCNLLPEIYGLLLIDGPKGKKVVERKNESPLIEKVVEVKKDQVVQIESENDPGETEAEGSEEKNEKDKKAVKRKNESQLIEKVAEAKKDQVMESKSESDLVETERAGSEEQNKDVLDEKD